MEEETAAEGSAAKNETKEEKFKRLAEHRVNNALDKLRLIGNLASSQYSFTTEQVEKMLQSLRSYIQELEDKFRMQLDKKKQKFEL